MGEGVRGELCDARRARGKGCWGGEMGGTGLVLVGGWWFLRYFAAFRARGWGGERVVGIRRTSCERGETRSQLG